jgi:hypothetical protein
MNLKRHKMKLLETVIITDRDRQILGMKVLLRMLNSDTLFNSESDNSDIIVVNYTFDDIELFTFKNLDDSLIISDDQKYIKKYAKLLKNTEMPVEMVVDQYINGVLPAFLEENEIKIEYVSPLIVEGEKLHLYIEQFRKQTMFRKS